MQENSDWKADEERLGEGTINRLASIVADGTASPDDARSLLAEFARQVGDGKQISRRLLEHMRDCVAAFLDGRKVLLPATPEGRDRAIGVPIPNLEKAFGIVRAAPGNPRTDDDTFAEVAMEVLEKRLGGMSLEDASAEVAQQRKKRGVRVSSESQVRDAWAKHKADGLTSLRILKLSGFGDSAGWSPEERARLTQLFWGELWFVPPGVDAKARQDAILAEVDRPGASNLDLDARLKAVVARFDGTRPPKIPNNTSA